MNLIIHGIFPLMLLIILNTKIYYRIKLLGASQPAVSSTNTQPRDVRHTQVSLGIAAGRLLGLGCGIVGFGKA